MDFAVTDITESVCWLLFVALHCLTLNSGNLFCEMFWALFPWMYHHFSLCRKVNIQHVQPNQWVLYSTIFYGVCCLLVQLKCQDGICQNRRKMQHLHFSVANAAEDSTPLLPSFSKSSITDLIMLRRPLLIGPIQNHSFVLSLHCVQNITLWTAIQIRKSENKKTLAGTLPTVHRIIKVKYDNSLTMSFHHW